MGSDLKKPLGFTIINKKNYKSILWNMDIGENAWLWKNLQQEIKKNGYINYWRFGKC